VERRAAAIEAALEAQGWKAGEHVAEATRRAEEEWVPANGARLVARAWTDPAFRERLFANGLAAAAELGFTLPKHHRHLVVLENTPAVHNVICCTLCSCTAFTIIGLPPDWYKDLEYRARVVRESRTVLKEMGSCCRPRSRSASGTPPPTRATSSCRCGRGHRGLVRGTARGARDARLDDRRRPPLGEVAWTASTTSAAGKASARCATCPTRRRSTPSGRKRINALYGLAVRRGLFNMDEYRHAIERMEPRHYLSRATTSAPSRAWRRCASRRAS
jgi:nitrile hydratase